MSGNEYSRNNPSLRYRELIVQYKRMHAEGYKFNGQHSRTIYFGNMVLNHAKEIKDLIRDTGSKSLLDYGSGKGWYYKDHLNRELSIRHPFIRIWGSLDAYWGIEKVRCFDPGYPPFQEYPTGTYEGVICTDVLEHCPEEDLPWILKDLFDFADKFLFATVALYPAIKFLPSGENVHCTVKSWQWWEDLFNQHAERSNLPCWKVIFEGIDNGVSSRIKEIGKSPSK